MGNSWAESVSDVLLQQPVEQRLREKIVAYVKALQEYSRRVEFGDYPSYSEIEIPKIEIADALLQSLDIPTEPVTQEPMRVTSDAQGKRNAIPTDVRWMVWERDNFTCKGCGYRKNLTLERVRLQKEPNARSHHSGISRRK